MNICDNCDVGKHRRCTGCDCALCPIVNRREQVYSGKVNKPAKTLTDKPKKVTKTVTADGVLRGRGRPALPIPEPMRLAIAACLDEGVCGEEIMRRAGISRQQLVTFKKNRYGPATPVQG